jgi:hypothetical protein
VACYKAAAEVAPRIEQRISRQHGLGRRVADLLERSLPEPRQAAEHGLPSCPGDAVAPGRMRTATVLYELVA